MQKEEWYPAKREPGVSGRFGYEKIIDVKASLEADEERYKDIVCLYTRVAASKDIPPPQKVLPQNQREFIERFPEAWQAFQTGERLNVPGTTLDKPFHDLPAMSEQEILRYELNGVVTWEQLAELSDQQCANVGFGVRKQRDNVMARMGRQIPGKPPMQTPAAAIDAIEPDGGAVNGVMAASSPAAAPETEAPALPPAPRRRPGRPRKTA